MKVSFFPSPVWPLFFPFARISEQKRPLPSQVGPPKVPATNHPNKKQFGVDIFPFPFGFLTHYKSHQTSETSSQWLTKVFFF